jgi:RHS repeat-associated protein
MGRWKTGKSGWLLRMAATLMLTLPLAWAATPVATQGSPPAPTPPATRIAETTGVTVAQGQAYFAGAAAHTFEADENTVHPMIAAAARRLQNNPDRIYEFVYSAIAVEPTFGLQKGAVGTLTHRRGTPFDQAELMVQLLRAASTPTAPIQARYRMGPVTLTGAQMLDWQGTNNTVAVRRLLNDGGFPNDVAGAATVTSATFLSVWVEANIGGQWYAFDPAFKAHDWYTAADFKTLMGYNRANVRAAAGTVTATGTVPQVSATYANQLPTLLTSYATSLANGLTGATHVNKSSEEVLGQNRIRPITRTQQRVASLPHAPTAGSVTWDEIPDAFRTKITVVGYPTSGSPVSLEKYGDSHYADLYRMSASPTAPPNFLWLDIPPWGVGCQGACQGLEVLPYATIAVSLDHPYAAGAGLYGDKTYATKTSSTRSEPAGGNNPSTNLALRGVWLSLGRDTDRGLEIYQRQAAKHGYCMVLGWPFGNPSCIGSATTDPALVNVAKAATLAEGIGGARIANHHAVMFNFYTQTVHNWTNAQWNPPYPQNYTYEGGEATMVSIQSQISVTPRSGVAADRTAAIGGHAALFQAAESIGVAQSVKRNTPQDIWAEYAATGSTNRFIWMTAANYNTAKNSLTGYTGGIGNLKLTRIQEYTSAGYTVLAPKSGTIGPGLLPNLKSAAFWVVAPTTGEMSAVYVDPGSNFIVLKGAGASRPMNDAKPAGLSKQFMDEYNRGLFDPSGALSVDSQTGLPSFAPPTLLSTGSGDFPRRLDFKIKISGEPTSIEQLGNNQASPRLGGNGTYLGQPRLGGYAVYTSLEHDLSLGEDLGLAYGERAPWEAASAITAAVVSMEEARATADALSGLVVMGSQSWLGRQLEDGAATIVHGVDGVEKFIRKPDGTWRAPPDSLESLIQIGSPSFVGAFNRRGYLGVTFLWRGRDGVTKSFRQPTPGTANDTTPSTGAQLSNCMGSNSATNAEVEKAYWGIAKGFVLDTWTMPGGEWVKGEYTDSVCGVIALKRLKNNYGRFLEFAYSTATTETVPYVFDENGRAVQMVNMGAFNKLAPDSNPPGVIFFGAMDLVGTAYDLGLVLPNGEKLWIEADQCRGTMKSPYTVSRQYCDRLRLFYNDPKTALQTVSLDPDDPSVTAIEDADGVTMAYAAMPGHRQATIDENAGVTSTVYDASGKTIEDLSPSGRLTTYIYDGRGRLKDQRLALATAPTIYYGRTSFSYDNDGRQIEQRVHTWTDPLTGLPYSGNDIVTQTVWNTTWNKPAIQRDARNKETTFTYSSVNGFTSQIDGPTGERTIYSYDSLGRLQETRVLIRSSPAVAERVTQYGYDAAGNASSIIVNPGVSALTTNMGYDVVGNLTSVVNPRGYQTTAAYDVTRRLIQVDGAAGSQVVMLYGANGKLYRAEQKTSTAGKPSVLTWDYLPSGRVRAATDPDSKTTVYTHDALGRIRYIDDPKGRRTEYGYTAEGEVAFITSGVGSSNPSTKSLSYYPDGQVRYHRDGKYAEAAIEIGTVENLRDAWGRAAGMRYGGGAQYETATRDPAGNVLQIRIRDLAPASGGVDQLINFTYDDSNRQLTKIVPTTTAGKNVTTANTYSLAGEALTSTISDDRVPGITQRVANTYEDATGRLSSESWWEKYGVTPALTTSYEYDGVGNRTAIIWPDAYRATYVFDSQDRVTQIGWARPGGSSGTFATLTPDPQGQASSIAFANGSSMAFDMLSSGLPRQISYNFPTSGSFNFSYGYDDSGRQTFEQSSDVSYISAPTAPNVNQTFNSVSPPGHATNSYNQYESVVTNTAGTPVTANYTYDRRGNLTSNATQLFEYNLENRMERVTTLGGVEIVKYGYDPTGRRSVKALTGGAKTLFLHAGQTEIADIDGATSAVLRRYIPGSAPGQWVAFVDEQAAGAIKYVHQNRLGSVVALSSATGSVAVSDKFSYDAYGKSAAPVGGFPFRYTGQRLDPETGLYYLRARYYDPGNGRFLQNDPVGVDGGLNLYAYVGNNPLNLIDPSGHGAEGACLATPLLQRLVGDCRDQVPIIVGVPTRAEKAKAKAKGAAMLEPYRSQYDRNDPRYHEYDVLTSICRVNGTTCTVKKVDDALVHPPFRWNQESAEGAYSLPGVHLWDDNPIDYFRPEPGIHINRTKKGHMFHPGDASTAVFESGGYVWVYTLGYGHGEYRWFNKNAGRPLFEDMHSNVWRRFNPGKLFGIRGPP